MLHRLLRRARWGWTWTQHLAAVLLPSWFAALVIGLVSLALLHPQSRDAVGSIAEDGFLSWSHFWLLASVVTLATTGWYFPRALLYVRYWYTPNDPRNRFGVWRRWVPQVLGILPIASLAVAFLWQGKLRYALSFLAVGFVILVLISRRRALVARLPFVPYRRGAARNLLEAEHQIRAPGARMPGRTWLYLGFYVVTSSGLTVAFLFSRVAVPQTIGPMGIVFFSATVLIVFVSLALVYPAHRRRLPPLVLLAVLMAAVFGSWNDNHEVRRGSETAPAPRPELAAYLDDWLAYRPEAQAATAEDPYPVFVVAAEGGGIRAAYWTAVVLAHLADTYPTFACHLFAVSGVSGGSLGAAVFSALLAERAPNRCDGCRAAATTPLLPPTDRILGRDFLGPALAGMLYPDFLQRFCPVPLFPDRATYLEEAWEDAWRTEIGNDVFAGNFLALWADEETQRHVPSLFLNGTWVESGARVVTSNLVPPPRENQGHIPHDMLGFLGRPLPVSTAVHMSARFTYVSPPGTVSGTLADGEELTLHVVDGGYFENSGALTASELVAALEALRREGGNPHVYPVGITISNSPRRRASWSPFMKETLAPLLALLATRTARGEHAESVFQAAVEGFADEGVFPPARLLRFELQDEEVYPLGWMLSDRARAAIRAELRNDENLPSVTRVGELLGR